MAEWLTRLTRKPKVRTAVGSNPALDSLVAFRNSSPDRPEPCEGNRVAAAGSCGGLMVKYPWPLLEISLSDFHRITTLSINTYLPTYLPRHSYGFILQQRSKSNVPSMSIIIIINLFEEGIDKGNSRINANSSLPQSKIC